MNKKMIALAIAGVMSAPLAAQAEVTVYGKLHFNAGQHEVIDNGVTDVDNFQFNSFDSRLGVKGEHKLGESGLSGTYKIELGVNPDSDGDSSTDTTYTDSNGDTVTVTDTTDGTAGIVRRNMYAGLKGNFGEVRFGRHDSPLKMAQGKFDQFGDTLGDLKHAGSQDGENRFDNVMAYLGKAGDLGFAVALIPSEGDGTTSGDGIADSTSVSVSYKAGPMYIAVANDNYDDTGAAAGSANSLTRVVGTYKFGGSQVGLLWQSGVEKVTSEANEEDWMGISFNTKIGSDMKFKAQYIMVEDSKTGGNAIDNTLTAVGLEKKFDKYVSGYVMHSALDKSVAKDEVNSTSVGLVVKF